MGDNVSPKILFTTAATGPYEYYSSRPIKRFFSFRQKHPSLGLQFIKRNIPQIEILEYPTWEEYCQKLEEGWDVVGFSFYLYQTYEVLRMIREARRRGVKEIWGGNYGVLTPEIQKYFDRIFIGYAEKEVAKALGVKIGEIKHPFLWADISAFPFLPLKSRVGYLFACRGCNIGCYFCQTPSFCPRISIIPLSSIKEILERYEEKGIKRVFIGDENFGIYREHSERVIDVLNEYGFEWFCSTRPEILIGKVEGWREKGLVCCVLGVESLTQKNLNYIHVGKKVTDTLDAITELHDNGVQVITNLIIGYPDQSESDIEREAETLASLDPAACQAFILTPFPKTPMWSMLSKYGPFDPDYSKYDCFNLVWNHPKISKERMRELLLEIQEQIYTWDKHLRNLVGAVKTVISKRCPIYFGW